MSTSFVLAALRALHVDPLLTCRAEARTRPSSGHHTVTLTRPDPPLIGHSPIQQRLWAVSEELTGVNLSDLTPQNQRRSDRVGSRDFVTAEDDKQLLLKSGRATPGGHERGLGQRNASA